MLNHEDAIRNILAILDLATKEDWESGVAWYRNAKTHAGIVGRSAGFKGRKAYRMGAGILAALSPSCKWERNVEAGYALVANGGVRSATDATRIQSEANVAKASKIYRGAEPLEVLGGDKVRAFYACILNPLDPRVVCIDRHAAAVAYGKSLTDSEMREAVKVTKRDGSNYERLADAYRAAAAARGLLPLELQAITWVVWRRLKSNEE